MTPLQTAPQQAPNFIPKLNLGAPPRPAFYVTLAFVFVVYARVPEIMDMVLGAALHSARFLMALSFVAMLLFGGSWRALGSRLGICVLAFSLWLCVCTPFSVWRGGSVRVLKEFWLMAMFSFAIIAITTQGLEQCRRLMYTLAAASAFIEFFTLALGRVQGGRMSLLGGTLGNANYLAMMLLMGLPFCLFVLRTKPGMSILKFVCVVMMLCIPVTVSATGSRGGLVTLAAMFLLYFLPLPISQKMVVSIAVLILGVVAITWSTRSALERYKTIFSNSSELQLTDSEKSAIDSMGLRKELLLSSVQLTLRHPLFGVGPGMFSVANASFMEETNGRANWNAWHETHNTFTQVSCEDGLPGLFLYCLTLFFCFKVVFAARKLARSNPALSTLGHMAFALQLALIAFTGTSLFASNAYAYYFPMLAGMCVALERTCAELKVSLAAPENQPVDAPPPLPKPALRPRRPQIPAAQPVAWNRPASR